MSKLYEITVCSSMDSGGVLTYLTAGDAVEVEGQLYARLAHGTLVPANGWHDTLAAAQAAAAEQIDAIGRKVLEQAACLREASRG